MGWNGGPNFAAPNTIALVNMCNAVIANFEKNFFWVVKLYFLYSVSGNSLLLQFPYFQYAYFLNHFLNFFACLCNTCKIRNHLIFPYQLATHKVPVHFWGIFFSNRLQKICACLFQIQAFPKTQYEWKL